MAGCWKDWPRPPRGGTSRRNRAGVRQPCRRLGAVEFRLARGCASGAGHEAGAEGGAAESDMSDWRIRMAGDAAVTVEFEPRIDPVINARVVALAAGVRAAGYAGVRDVVPSYSAVTVYVDPIRTDFDRLWAALDAAAGAVAPATGPAREIVVPVQYGGPAGPDLDEVARFAGCSADEVIRRHTAPRYRVYMLGFLPGFPYLGVVDARIAMPRRASPRLAVPARAVGIAGRQTGIYPTIAPGGWRLIGLAVVDPFDVGREPPCLFRPGDTVRFVAVASESRS